MTPVSLSGLRSTVTLPRPGNTMSPEGTPREGVQETPSSKEPRGGCRHCLRGSLAGKRPAVGPLKRLHAGAPAAPSDGFAGWAARRRWPEPVSHLEPVAKPCQAGSCRCSSNAPTCLKSTWSSPCQRPRERGPQLPFRRLLVDVGHLGARALRALVRCLHLSTVRAAAGVETSEGICLMHQRPGLASQGSQTHVI